MRQHDAVDVGIREACFLQTVKQDVPFFLHAKPIAELRREEGADPRFEEDSSVAVFDQQRPACEWNPIELVGLDPLTPQRARRVAEHRAAIESL
jgi:hypothetical protein